MDVITSGGAITTVHDIRQIGPVVLKENVTAKVSAHTILAGENGTLFTNDGSSGSVALTLPTAVEGLCYGFFIQAAQTFTINAASGDTIRSGTDVTGAGGDIADNTIGNYIKIKAINATEWVAESITGTWTFT